MHGVVGSASAYQPTARPLLAMLQTAAQTQTLRLGVKECAAEMYADPNPSAYFTEASGEGMEREYRESGDGM